MTCATPARAARPAPTTPRQRSGLSIMASTVDDRSVRGPSVGRRGRDLLRGGLGLLVFLAVLPSVVPYDHLFVHAHREDAAHEAVHASHCHISPGTCSDAPVASGPGRFLVSDPLVVVPAMLAVLIVMAARVLYGVSPRQDTRPPRRRIATV